MLELNYSIIDIFIILIIILSVCNFGLSIDDIFRNTEFKGEGFKNLIIYSLYTKIYTHVYFDILYEYISILYDNNDP